MPLVLNRTCRVEDFADPELRSVLREVFAHHVARDPAFPAGREHRKHWEVAMAILTLRRHGVLRRDAEVLGVGAGAEPTVFWLTNLVGRVFATDRYAQPENWEAEAHPSMLWAGGDLWPGVWNPRRLVVQHMDARALAYEDASFDAVFSSGSIEHFGTLEEIATAMAEAHRVLRPGGICTLSTEFLVAGDPLLFPNAVMFDVPLLQKAVLGAGWQPLDAFDLEITQATRDSLVPYEAVYSDHARHRAEHDGLHRLEELELSDYPHVLFRQAGNVHTSVHLALRKTPARAGHRRRLRTETSMAQSGSIAAVRGLAHHLERPVAVLDVGCRWGFATRWERLAPHIALYGIDADPDEVERLRARYAGSDWAHLEAVALGEGDGTTARLRSFGLDGLQSLYEHAPTGLPAFAIPTVHQPVGPDREVTLITLDSWTREHGVPAAHVVKLDVQGHELAVLRGAEAVLGSVRIVEVEVCLNPLFDGAPLFGEVDAFLRDRGFRLYRLRDIAYYPVRGGDGAPGWEEAQLHWGFEPTIVPSAPGMISYADALYVREDLVTGVDAAEQPTGEQQLLADAVACDALTLHDLTLISLRALVAASLDPAVLNDARRAVGELLAARGDVPDATPQAPSESAEPTHLPLRLALARRFLDPRAKRADALARRLAALEGELADARDKVAWLMRRAAGRD
ncbi:MAG: FkbM family methyltransferase [Solirubrobacteraceae bacterium]